MITISNPKILVPLDFSRCSEYALEYAKAIAKPLHGSLHLLHVVAPPIASIELVYAYEQEMITKSYTNAAAALKKEVELLTKEGVVVTSEIMSGTPYYCIAEYANANNIDLLIISTHGRHGFERLLMGSTTERVLRTVQCPVLAVHPPKHLFEENGQKSDKNTVMEML